MMYGVFAVFDSAIQSWLPPLYARNKGDMMRQFIEACNNPQTKFSQHPGDFCLFEIGQWNDESCEFTLLKAPVRLGVAIEFVKERSEGGAGGMSPPSGSPSIGGSK